ncbi:MAG TPA: tetraacyldisaccharide 4'-kinase [Coxiellaceae bacterium]|nr:MAG: tetraacyldisaccharide 4'-kinase [Gammaproteobacteria bacterium RIFCSPHIGHO2_12_FULL_36_30]HLB56730.1 tetraacyldisaccharide 4'-kinase [Coxiellaceae bacterium]
MNNIWYKKNIFQYLLFPFLLIYRVIIFIRYYLYKKNIFKSYKINAPVIVVGNISVGGTGKTPLVIALVNELKENGFFPGVISRGYGGKSKKSPIFVDQNSDPNLVGDEAILIAKKTDVPVVVGANRVDDAKKLLEMKCNVVISDDGLQHYALQRDIEIAVIDGTRGFGNGFCLPAGPLREPISRLRLVDFILINGNALMHIARLPKGVSLTAATHIHFTIDDFVNIHNENKKLNLSELKNKKIIAVAGVGNPERFFNSLRTVGIVFSTKIFPDHHAFEKKDFESIADDIIIMTEKDAVKCNAFSDDRFYMARGHINVDDVFFQAVMRELKK